MKTKTLANASDLANFSFFPIAPDFVPPKPRHSIEKRKALELDKQGLLIKTRKRNGYSYNVVSTREGINLYTRTGRPVTHLYPELVADLHHHHIPYDSIFPMELVADKDGADAFPDVVSMAKTEKDRAEALQAADIKASLMPFNVLAYDGKWVHELPNEERFAMVDRQFEQNSGSSVLRFQVLNVSLNTAIRNMRAKKWEGLVLTA